MRGASSGTIDELRVAMLNEAEDNGELTAEFGEEGARLRAIAIKISKETTLIDEDMSRTHVWEAFDGWLMISSVSPRLGVAMKFQKSDLSDLPSTSPLIPHPR